MLPINCRSSKVAEERTAREHMTGRSRKLVCDADVNVLCALSTAPLSVEDIHSVDSDCSAKVDGKPGRRLLLCVAHVLINQRMSSYVSVNALRCWELCPIITLILEG